MVLAILAVLGAAWSGTPRSVAALGPPEPDGVLTGVVTSDGGSPTSGLAVDLFDARPGSSDRAGYLASAVTDSGGRYRFEVGDGCYVVVVIAPTSATFAAGSRHWQQPVCLADGHQARTLAATLVDPATSSVRIGGRITHRGGAPAPALTVQVFRAEGDGGRGPYLHSVQTDARGRFVLKLAPGCHVVVMTAPDGDRFDDGAQARNRSVCGQADQVVTGLEATLASTQPPPSPLSAVEREIVRLTNELRADPSGPLARRQPMPSCVTERFYAITIDPATGHPEPPPPLTVDEALGVRMGRAWADELARSGRFEHRSSPAQQDILASLGRSVTAWGENIAWFSGYDRDETARVHFEGWRESDTGHYCSMLSPRFTHLGVGAVNAEDQSWAVQNFYG